MSPSGPESDASHVMASSEKTLDSTESRKTETQSAGWGRSSSQSAPHAELAQGVGPPADVAEPMQMDTQFGSPHAAKPQSTQQPSEVYQQSATQPLGDDTRSTDVLHRQKPSHAGKPLGIPHAPNLPLRKYIPHSLEFASIAGIKAALASAWSRSTDIGVQAAVLYELFGDAILPYVPMLPLMS